VKRIITLLFVCSLLHGMQEKKELTDLEKKFLAAAQSGTLETFKECIARNVNVNCGEHTDDGTALHRVTHQYDTALFDTILQCKNIKIDAKNFMGQTPLHIITGFLLGKKKEYMALQLLKAGANPNIRPGLCGKSALHEMVESYESTQWLETLIKYGGTSKKQDCSKFYEHKGYIITPLLSAINYGVSNAISKILLLLPVADEPALKDAVHYLKQFRFKDLANKARVTWAYTNCYFLLKILNASNKKYTIDRQPLPIEVIQLIAQNAAQEVANTCLEYKIRQNT
jgi:hypothetical protein